MEDTMVQENPGLVTRFVGLFAHKRVVEEDEEYVTLESAPTSATRPSYRYSVTIRRQIFSFEDALEAAKGLKHGEQQILNLCNTDLVTRQKIVDFMSGVNYAQEGTWEELGENVYLVAPAHAFVEVAPASSRSNSR